MTTNVTLLITTDEFIFTNAEVGFIKKNFQRKYPAVMGDFIDQVRLFMKAIQLKGTTRLTYGAYRYTPENSKRYHISECLQGQQVNGENREMRVFISLQPVESEKRVLFAENRGQGVESGLKTLFADLNAISKDAEAFYNHAATFNGVPFSFVVARLLEFLDATKSQTVVQACEIDVREQGCLVLDLTHRGSRSHYLRIVMDFA